MKGSRIGISFALTVLQSVPSECDSESGICDNSYFRATRNQFYGFAVLQ